MILKYLLIEVVYKIVLKFTTKHTREKKLIKLIRFYSANYKRLYNSKINMKSRYWLSIPNIMMKTF